MKKYLLPNNINRNPALWSSIKQTIQSLLISYDPPKLEKFVLDMLANNGVAPELDGGEEYKRFLARTNGSQPVKVWEVPGLKILNTEKGRVMENILKWSLQLESKFPTGELPVFESGQTGEIELSRGEVMCLLSHMVLATLPSTEVRETYCWSSLQPWLTRDKGPPTAYLSCLASLFAQHEAGDTALDCEKIRFRRLVSQESDLPDWSHSQTPLTALETSCPSSIGRQEPDQVEMDFANRDLGFGPGGSQEEILFGMTPEACPAVLLSPSLQAREGLLISGVRRTGDWTGYGWDVEYSGPGDNLPRTILCLDALELEEGSVAQEQAGGEQLWRELGKCLTGFLACQGREVNTGAWGCGVFRGDRDVKLAIQLAAASEARVACLRYHTSDRELSQIISATVKCWRDNGWTVGHVVRELISFANTENCRERFFRYSTDKL